MSDSDKMKITIFNPCKNCLKRPVCNRECKDFINHKDTQEMGMALTVLLSLIFGYIISIYLISTLNVVLVWAAIMLLIPFYFFSIDRLIKEDETISENKKIVQLIILILNPWGELATNIIDGLKLDSKIIKHCYRYKKNIWDRY